MIGLVIPTTFPSSSSSWSSSSFLEKQQKMGRNESTWRVKLEAGRFVRLLLWRSPLEIPSAKSNKRLVFGFFSHSKTNMEARNWWVLQSFFRFHVSFWECILFLETSESLLFCWMSALLPFTPLVSLLVLGASTRWLDAGSANGWGFEWISWWLEEGVS